MMNDERFRFQLKKKAILFGSILLAGILAILYFGSRH